MSQRTARLLRLLAIIALNAPLLLVACVQEPSSVGEVKLAMPDPHLAADQTLRVNLGGEPKTIDPHKANFEIEVAVVRQLFSPLLWFDKDLRVIPWVAREVPSRENDGVSPDGLTYTFKLRSDVLWSDGRRVTAADFEYSFKRAMDPRTASPYASLYYEVEGAQELNEATNASATEIAALKAQVGVWAKDETTLVVTLKNPRLSFPYLTALWVMYPVRQDVIERHGDRWTEAGNLIGNGPFLLKEWVHHDHITLVRNENWFAPLGNKAKLQTVVYRMISDVTVAWAGYQRNELDISAVPPAHRREVMTEPRWKNELLRGPEPATAALVFNNAVRPFDKKEVRQAFGMAVDREALVSSVLQGVGRPAYSWIPPGMPGYDRELGRETFAMDVTRARQLLAQAGYQDGQELPEIKLTLSDTDLHRYALVPFLREQFYKNLGIELKVELLDPRSYQSAFTESEFQLAFAGWHADYPDQENWLPNLFGCIQYTGSRCSRYASNNQQKYSNPRFDELVRQARWESEPRRRAELWAEAQKLVIQDAAVAPLYYREMFYVAKPKLRSIQHLSLDSVVPGEHYLFNVYIAAR